MFRDWERMCRNVWRSSSSRKMFLRSFPRHVTWYTAPGYWMRNGLAMALFYSGRLDLSIIKI
jgi:hypothetical protein